MDVYFATSGYRNKWEIDIIRELRPPKILVSYFYFRNHPLDKFIEDIGYCPDIMLDSGAYSAWSTGKNISPIDYMRYIQENYLWVKHFISLDVIGDGELSWDFYKIMRKKGFNPIPCFHYGDDEELLQRYIDDGNDYIALGNTVPVKDKAQVAWWLSVLIQRYPGIKFHLLGSSSEKITSVEGLYSCDASTWVTMAVMGKPPHIKGKTREAKIERAKYWMNEIMRRNVG
jgi:hypothetical protein